MILLLLITAGNFNFSFESPNWKTNIVSVENVFRVRKKMGGVAGLAKKVFQL